jgi:hypothetical protein
MVYQFRIADKPHRCRSAGRSRFAGFLRLPDEEKCIIKALLDGMLIKYQTKRRVSGLNS